VGSREVVQYRGAILPIVRLDRHLGAFGDSDREVLEVIVYADHGRSVAIVVEEILDIVDGEAAVQSDIDDLGLLGSAVIGDRVTELLDVRAAILAADPAFYAPALGSVPAGQGIDSSAFGFEGDSSTHLMEV
jgi:two-component system chemotaxis sensor kinase CheA